MDLSTALVLLSILAIIGSALLFLAKFIKKKVEIIAKEVILESQSLCFKERVDNLNVIVERVENLEQSDNNTQLTIVAIKKDLENLTSHHETTQMMIQRLEDHQQTTFSQLIDTFKSMAEVKL